MDFKEVFGFVEDYVFTQWIFIVASLVIGMFGQFFKRRVWTKERAATNRFFWWARATLTLHAPTIGGFAGVALCFVFGDAAPAGPGVEGQGQIILYYVGAGAVSSLVFAAVKKFAEYRGIHIEPVDLPGDVE